MIARPLPAEIGALPQTDPKRCLIPSTQTLPDPLSTSSTLCVLLKASAVPRASVARAGDRQLGPSKEWLSAGILQATRGGWLESSDGVEPKQPCRH